MYAKNTRLLPFVAVILSLQFIHRRQNRSLLHYHMVAIATNDNINAPLLVCANHAHGPYMTG